MELVSLAVSLLFISIQCTLDFTASMESVFVSRALAITCLAAVSIQVRRLNGQLVILPGSNATSSNFGMLMSKKCVAHIVVMVSKFANSRACPPYVNVNAREAGPSITLVDTK